MSLYIVIPLAISWLPCGWVAYKLSSNYFLRKYASLAFTIPGKELRYKPERITEVKARQRISILLGWGALIITLIVDRENLNLTEPCEQELRKLAQKYWIDQLKPEDIMSDDPDWLRITARKN